MLSATSTPVVNRPGREDETRDGEPEQAQLEQRQIDALQSEKDPGPATVQYQLRGPQQQCERPAGFDHKPNTRKRRERTLRLNGPDQGAGSGWVSYDGSGNLFKQHKSLPRS